MVPRAALALSALLLSTGAGVASEPPAPNVVLYVIDTLRADHLGCYGYARPTSPRMDAFARGAVLFTRATAQSSWTLPAIASILTGRLPGSHGAVGPSRAVRPEVPTLAELLRARGYDTAAFVTNYLGSAVFGLGRGFDVFRFYAERGDRRPGVYLDSETLIRRVVRRLPRSSERPFFLYVHATDPHFPYLPPRRYARAFERRDVPRPAYLALVEAMRPFHNGQERWGTRPAPIEERDVTLLHDLYDGEIRRADAGFGVLLDTLAARGLLEHTLVVLTADHGEEFLEHGGIAHGQTLYGEALHVPLVIRPPGEAPAATRLDVLAQHVDILPTILAAVGIPVPPEIDGTSLLEGHHAPEAHTSLRLAGRVLDAVATPEWKVIRDLGRPRARRFEAYRLGDDPGERRDVAGMVPDLVSSGRERIRLRDGSFTRGPRIPEERVGRLRALGYVVD